MNVPSLNYNSYQGQFVNAITSPSLRGIFSIPPIGKTLLNFFLDKAISYYTTILFEIAGLSEFIDEIPSEQAISLLPNLNKFLSVLKSLDNQLTYLEENAKVKEFKGVIVLIIQKIDDTVYLIEDKIHQHYLYSLSVNRPENDWADVENNHWENY